jgi:hypothetical protein
MGAQIVPAEVVEAEADAQAQAVRPQRVLADSRRSVQGPSVSAG